MKYYSTSNMFVFVIPILLCFASSVISQTGPLNFFCGTSANYTKDSAYQTNLNNLLSTITSDTGIDHGFYNFSSGKAPDSAHAIALCRGDVTREDCKSCLNDSTIALTQSCPYQKEAIVWYEKCMLRYSNSSSIFGTYMETPGFYMWNPIKVRNGTVFMHATLLGGLMANLSSMASSGDSRRKFAAGQTSLSSFETIYGLVQCTPDLTQSDCSACIAGCIDQLPCCSDKIGGRVLNPSCNIRFEPDQFFNFNVPPVSPPPVIPPTAVEDTLQTNITNSTGKKSEHMSRTAIIIVVVSVVALIVLIALFCIYFRSKKPRKNAELMGKNTTMESLQYSFSAIKLATNDFSGANQLGKGSFGAVYRGKLLDGQEIAVKRLAKGSGQGNNEFRAEAVLVGKLQHRNLVKLLGFCLEGDERLLIYEFVPNQSLDMLLFDRARTPGLDWETRYGIIGGIVKGLLYLHEDSRLKIIHRDLKASNILLDAEMNPKIADFGLARLFVADQTQDSTSRIVGTYGYMAPEYAMHGHFSVKSDVYSFGVLLLEIIAGRKNASFQNGQQSVNLITYAWENWKDGTIANLVDPTLRGGADDSEITRCIHIGLLSVQENESDRPTMASIAMMLNSNSMTLPAPLQPSSYFMPNVTDGGSSVTTGSGNYHNANIAMEVSVNDMSFTEFYPR